MFRMSTKTVVSDSNGRFRVVFFEQTRSDLSLHDFKSCHDRVVERLSVRGTGAVFEVLGSARQSD